MSAPPPRIHALDQLVINRIAAGEVVVSPAAAVKELLENSIDAGATSVTVTTRAGGIKSFQIQDNGHGIVKDDLKIVCERFTTSKLNTFEDLQQISTYGFRGEALASITHVAKVTITSKPEAQQCAFRATYCDGKIVVPQRGQKAEPRPCAGVKGTTILVEDLFYNVTTRKRALRTPSEEYGKILDVVTKYAIHAGASTTRSVGVAMTCKKSGASTSDLHTLAKSTVKENIKSAYGSTVGNELIEIQGGDLPDASARVGSPDGDQGLEPGGSGSQSCASSQVKNGESQSTTSNTQPTAPNAQPTAPNAQPTAPNAQPTTPNTQPALATCGFTFRGYITNANYSRKKSEYVIFINHRLVSCSSLKRAFEAIYSEFLPKGAYPFVYLSLELPPEHVDVNVHPTKKEVHFLNEEGIVQAIQTHVRGKLEGANTSRVFQSQTILLTEPVQRLEADPSSPGVVASSTIPASDESAPPSLRKTRSVGDPSSAGPINPLESTAPRLDDGSGPSAGGERRTSKRAAATLSLSQYAMPGSQVVSFDATPVKQRKVQPKKYVRTNSQSVHLDQYFYSPQSSRGTATKRVVPPKNVSLKKGKTSEQMPDGEDGTVSTMVGEASENLDEDDEGGSIDDDGVNAQEPVLVMDDDDFADSDDPVTEEALNLTSVQDLVSEIDGRSHHGLQAMLKKHVFVGVVDPTFALVQVDTRLYTVDHKEMAKELFYQQVLRNFGTMHKIVLQPSLSVLELMRIALGGKTGCDGNMGGGGPGSEVAGGGAAASVENRNGKHGRPINNTNVDDLARQGATKLIGFSEMLNEYFSIKISGSSVENAKLCALPEVIANHSPVACALPLFLLRLANHVEWTDEKNCFRSVAWEIGELYAELPLTERQTVVKSESNKGEDKQPAGVDVPRTKDDAISDVSADAQQVNEDVLNILKHVLFPAFRRKLSPPPEFAEPGNAIVVQVASLENLYKIFERC